MKRSLVAVLVVAMAFLPVWQARVLADATGGNRLTLNEVVRITAWEIVQEENRLPMPCRWEGNVPPEGWYTDGFGYSEPPGKLRGRSDKPVELTQYSWEEIRNTFPMRVGGLPEGALPELEAHVLDQAVEVLMLNAYCQRVKVVLPAGTDVLMDPATGEIRAVPACANAVLEGLARPVFTAEVVEEDQRLTPLKEFLLEPEPEPLIAPVPVAADEEDEDDGISPWWLLLGAAPLLFLLGGDEGKPDGTPPDFPCTGPNC